jgi:glutamate/tyrosine decarboxylase-like PLP-dependent enzyme
MDADPLAVDPDTMRRLGYLTVDWLVDREIHRREEPVLQQASPTEMAKRIPATIPRHGQRLEDILDHLAREVLPFRSRIDHPRYLAYVPGAGTWPGALGDLIASTYNIDVGNWMESAGPSQLERTVLEWFAQWIGYPDTSEGILVSGGSAANLTALACAREAVSGAMSDDLVVYVSDQGHSSLARAARVLGFGPQQVRVLPVDDHFRMRVDALAAAIDADLAAGRRPLAVLAVAGSTNTGAVDRLAEIAAFARRHGVWLHVDAAYGGFAAVTSRGRDLLKDVHLADSVTLDPHKWLYQPFECGALLVREGHRLPEAFEIHPDYLQDSMAGPDREVNFADRGLQLTRMSRALKLWISLNYYGLEPFTAAVNSSLDLAEHAQHCVEASSTLELMSPACLGVVCFRRHPPGVDDELQLERLNTALVADLAASGQAMVSSTRLLGRYCLRVCILNHTTTIDDVEHVVTWLGTAPTRLDESTTAVNPRAADVSTGWPFPDAGTADSLRELPLLHAVDDSWVNWVAAVARRRHLAAGDEVVRRWELDRDFYLLLEGTADVSVEQRHLATLHVGDFFGELAALDWGASYGYPRLATVTARTNLQLLVLTDTQLRDLMAAVPHIDAQIRAAAATRLRRG